MRECFLDCFDVVHIEFVGFGWSFQKQFRDIFLGSINVLIRLPFLIPLNDPLSFECASDMRAHPFRI